MVISKTVFMVLYNSNVTEWLPYTVKLIWFSTKNVHNIYNTIVDNYIMVLYMRTESLAWSRENTSDVLRFLSTPGHHNSIVSLHV